MRVVLVHPAGSNFVPGKKDVTVVVNRMVPTGIISIAAFLERAGIDVYVHDCLGPFAPPGVIENTKEIAALDPDIVGFSATTSSFTDALEIAKGLKLARPETLTVCGGVHASSVGASLLERFRSLDSLVVGEGEEAMLDLARGVPLSEIGGLVWRDNDRVVTNPPRTLIGKLDDLPFPAYEKLAGFPKGYHLPPFSYIHSPGATMSTSRGCVYQCSYCDRSVFKKGFRSNSADYVYEHMKYLRTRFGVRHVNIYDDLFTTNRKRIVDLCDRLTRTPLGMEFNCSVRVGHADNDLLTMLKAAGCMMVSIGIESGDPQMLTDLKAGATLEQVEDTVQRIQAAGLRAKGLFMMGVVGETEASIKKTSDFIISLDLDDMNVSKFTPFPGAPCYSTIREHGTFNEDWNSMNCLNFVFIPNALNSKEQLDQLYNQHVKRFYKDPKWRRRLKRRLWQHRSTLWRMAKDLPSFLAAKRHFEPQKNKTAISGSETSQ